jgi:hypothetical protein
MMPRLDRGLTRVVLLTRRWAIKVPRLYLNEHFMWGLTRGIQANLSERDQTQLGQRGVCPVRWSFAGLVNVYPRCAPVTVMPCAEDLDAMGYVGAVDPKPQNLGRMLDGTIVWVDYDQSWNDCRRCAW